jgi:hypothetical protein
LCVGDSLNRLRLYGLAWSLGEFYKIKYGWRLYSSIGIFDDPRETLDDAVRRRFIMQARLLQLGPRVRLLDVSCERGSFAAHAAGLGVHVTALAQSPLEYEMLVRAAGAVTESKNSRRYGSIEPLLLPVTSLGKLRLLEKTLRSGRLRDRLANMDAQGYDW